LSRLSPARLPSVSLTFLKRSMSRWQMASLYRPTRICSMLEEAAPVGQAGDREKVLFSYSLASGPAQATGVT
jgi:hypothetical protein